MAEGRGLRVDGGGAKPTGKAGGRDLAHVGVDAGEDAPGGDVPAPEVELREAMQEPAGRAQQLVLPPPRRVSPSAHSMTPARA
eukprot:1498425-Rhodomonas_salina.1